MIVDVIVDKFRRFRIAVDGDDGAILDAATVWKEKAVAIRRELLASQKGVVSCLAFWFLGFKRFPASSLSTRLRKG